LQKGIAADRLSIRGDKHKVLLSRARSRPRTHKATKLGFQAMVRYIATRTSTVVLGMPIGDIAEISRASGANANVLMMAENPAARLCQQGI
jgi:hypothetical protein